MPSIPFQSNATAMVKAAVFVFFLSLYLATVPANLSDMANLDSKYMFWVCQSVVQDGDINIANQILAELKNKGEVTAGHGALIASQYPLFPSLIGVPFYMVGSWVAR